MRLIFVNLPIFELIDEHTYAGTFTDTHSLLCATGTYYMSSCDLCAHVIYVLM